MDPHHAIDAFLRVLQSAVPIDDIAAAIAGRVSPTTPALIAALVDEELLTAAQTVPALLILHDATDMSLGRRPFLPSVQAALHCATDARIRLWAAMLLGGDADLPVYRAMTAAAVLVALGKLDGAAVARIEAAASAAAAALPRPPLHDAVGEFMSMHAWAGSGQCMELRWS